MASANRQPAGRRDVRARLYFIALSATVKFVADMPRHASVAGKCSARLATPSMCANRAVRPRGSVCRMKQPSAKAPKAILLACRFVSFAEPGEDFGVEVFLARDAELIEIIVRREELHTGESRTLNPVLEPKPSDKTILRDTGNSGKAHPRLETYACLVDVHRHRSALAHQFQERAVELFVFGRLSEEGIHRE